MVTMRYCFVSAVWAVLMRAAGFRRAAHGICRAHRNHMFIDVILMHMVKMAVVKIVHMTVMAYRRMSAVGAVLMGVVGIMLLGAGGHNFNRDCPLPLFCSVLYRALHQSQNVSVGKCIVDVLCLASPFDKPRVV